MDTQQPQGRSNSFGSSPVPIPSRQVSSQQHFPTLSPQRAWSGTRITAFPASSTPASRPGSTINMKGSYNPNAYKQTDRSGSSAISPRPGAAVHGSRRGANGIARQHPGVLGSRKADDMEVTQLNEEEERGAIAPVLGRRGSMSKEFKTPEQQQQQLLLQPGSGAPQQRLFTFQAPMSTGVSSAGNRGMSTGMMADSRYTPEMPMSSSLLRSREVLSPRPGTEVMDGLKSDLSSSSPAATRRRLVPFSGSMSDDDGMDCDDDDTRGAASALLGLGGGMFA